MGECGRDCGCKGPSRRDVLQIGLAAAGVLAGKRAANAAAGEIPSAAKVPPPKAWFDELESPDRLLIRSGENLRNLTFPLGGIGSGTVWLNGAGRLVNWQIFNNIQKNALVDDSFLAVRIEQEGKPPVVRVLQHEPVGPFRSMADIEFLGRYPVATLTFRDPEVPAEIELDAYNPLIPLNAEDSAIPCVIFNVRVKNRTDAPIRVSLLASFQNAVGHAGAGASIGTRHPTYGGNVNKVIREGRMTAVSLSAQPGRPARIDPPIELLTDSPDLPAMTEAPVEGLSFARLGESNPNTSVKSVFWICEGDLKRLGGAVLKQVASGVREGGFLLLSGVDNPLLKPISASEPDEITRRETVFASFDGESFGQWRAEGKAFVRPRSGAVGDQQVVSGFTGPGLVNSFDPDDSPKGVLSSPSFVIHEKYISLLVGGGEHPGTRIALMVEGKPVRTARGKNSERLQRVQWDVADLQNQDAHIEIIDQESGPWGHILADDIRFSNLPIEAITADDARSWNELLRSAAGAPALNAVGYGRGKLAIAPIKLSGDKTRVDRIVQRDNLMATIAPLAGATYRLATGRPEAAPSFGTMCLAAGGGAVTVEPAWTNRDDLHRTWSASGVLQDPAAAAGAGPAGPSGAGETLNAALSIQQSADAGATVDATFVMTWHFPHQYYPQNKWRQAGNTAVEVGNMYANWFHDATSAAAHVLADLEPLRKATYAYRDAMFDTSLPQYLVDAAAANVSILRSPTCFWTKAGTFYGFEGCNYEGDGCCPMNCNHVWNYDQALAKVWPELERNMRVTELNYHQQDNGGINHRVEVPRDNPDKRNFPVADGQCGAVLKAYREHLQSPDRRFLDDHWPMIKKAMDFAISEWDPDGDGLMERPQFNTYDRVIFGHNTFVTSLYLAALRAAAEMAMLSRDENAAARYRELLEKGRAKAAETLFDGEYYIQKAEELKFGYGKGCLADQVVGQWWARVLNLGDVLPAEQVRSALRAIYKHNMLWTQEGFQGTQRFLQFADGGDKGLLICTWPKGGRPDDPILYRDEIWTGVEYQVAAHKLYEGQVTEALAIVRAVRDRYDGRKKSPWNEIECGDYYVRAMSSWSLLLAAQGYFYDGPAGVLQLDPRIGAGAHRSFFSTADGWGRFEQRREEKRQQDVLAVSHGRCELRELRFGLPAGTKSVQGKASLDDQPLNADVSAQGGLATIRLHSPITAVAGQKVTVALEWS
jgi:non-lysosomal glucosylceramidase